MVKEEKMEKIGFRCSAEEKQALAAVAKREDLSLSQVVRKACRDFLEKNQEKE